MNVCLLSHSEGPTTEPCVVFCINVSVVLVIRGPATAARLSIKFLDCCRPLSVRVGYCAESRESAAGAPQQADGLTPRLVCVCVCTSPSHHFNVTSEIKKKKPKRVEKRVWSRFSFKIIPPAYVAKTRSSIHSEK